MGGADLAVSFASVRITLHEAPSSELCTVVVRTLAETQNRAYIRHTKHTGDE